MRANGVVFIDPLVQNDLGLEHGAEQLAVEDLVAHRAVEPLDIGVLLRRALRDEQLPDLRWASQSARISEMNSRPLSERIRFGLPCLENTLSSSSIRSRAPMLRATRQARQRRVYSSTMFRIRSGCPSSVLAATKS